MQSKQTCWCFMFHRASAAKLVHQMRRTMRPVCRRPTRRTFFPRGRISSTEVLEAGPQWMSTGPGETTMIITMQAALSSCEDRSLYRRDRDRSKGTSVLCTRVLEAEMQSLSVSQWDETCMTPMFLEHRDAPIIVAEKSEDAPKLEHQLPYLVKIMHDRAEAMEASPFSK